MTRGSANGVSPALRVCIHQPTYFPWLGFFHKLLASDIYVVFDDCELGSPSWVPRVNVAVQGRAFLLTVPVHRRFSESLPLRLVKIDNSRSWVRKHLATLRQSYSRAPYADVALKLVDRVFAQSPEYLVELNLECIQEVCRLVGIETPMKRSSELAPSDLKGTERLVELTRAAGGTHYISGTGSSSYLVPQLFTNAGVAVSVQRFVMRSYKQLNCPEFVPGLSVVDALANVGPDRVRSLIETDQHLELITACNDGSSEISSGVS